mmetsp:Transcript_25919/g.82093  ORF Transcript_25919/g.82093 Transcript_25919/m.82093 type:complete len:145 (+) Transcript_25919:105-539(+)
MPSSPLPNGRCSHRGVSDFPSLQESEIASSTYPASAAMHTVAFCATIALLAGGAEALTPSMPAAQRVPSQPQPIASCARLTAAIKRGASRSATAVATRPAPPSVSAYGSARFDSWEDYAYTVYGDDEESTPFYDLNDEGLGLHR